MSSFSKTLEVRGNVKAKWVRVELRKIEVLPGGGQNNTFSETIGERPITLWASQQEEFAELSSNDFPFHINIPEAVPPSIALERGAAIKYELIASVMLKGKKSLFKRDPAPITTHTAPVVIEKYDLLQTWPIYAIQQSRTANANGVTLVANFMQSAFGPGDVVPVEAILRADVPGAGVILRAYELTVRETLIFRSSPPPMPQHNHPHLHLHSQPPQKRVPAAQTRSNIVTDQKVPVPVQLFPGSQHRCDLGCQIPMVQTNVTVRTARHIEVNYVVQVKAVLSNNVAVSVDLPVTITNWQRQASQDAVARIGFVPELTGGLQSPGMVSHPSFNPSLFQATNPGSSPNPPPNGNNYNPSLGNGPSNGAPSSAASSIPERVSRRSTVESPGRNTISSPPNNIATRTDEIDELGYVPAHAQAQAQTMPLSSGRQGGSDHASEPEGYFGNVAPLNQGPAAVAVPRPRSSSNRRSGAPQQRFTVVNVDEPADRKHLSAEEEKRLLRDKFANQDEQRRQRRSTEGGSGARPNSRPGTANSATGWASAEEEKKRLFEQARQAAARTQQGAGYSTDGYLEEPTPVAQPTGGSTSGETAGAGGSKANAGSGRKETLWPTAEEEKRRMFENARKAAAQTQQAAFNTPTPYTEDTPMGGGSVNAGDGFSGGWAFSSGGPISGAANGAGNASSVCSGIATTTPKPAPQQWMSAADEKRMLFEQARAAAERTQMGVRSGSPSVDSNLHAPVPTMNPTPASYGYSRSNSAFSGAGSTAGQLASSPASSEQRQQTISPPLANTPAAGKSGEELFAAGLAAMGRQSMYTVPQAQAPAPAPLPPQRTATPPYSAPGGSSLGHSPSQRRFPTAAEEKAKLAYMAAKQRVEQVRANEEAGGSSDGYENGNAYPQSPTVPSYDALYGSPAPAPAPAAAGSPMTRPLSVQRRTPSAPTTPPPVQSSPPPLPASDLPPHFTPNPGPTASALSALEEKARLRRQYEEQDAAAGSGSRLSPAKPPPSLTPPPPAPSGPPAGYGYSAHDEKERMRLMYAEQDATIRTGERRATTDSGRRAALPAPPTAPIPSSTQAPAYDAGGNGSDPPPFAGGFVNPATMKPLSAIEEKARLRAQYEAEANGHAINGAGSSDEPPPPSFDSHYQSQSPPQHFLPPPDRSGVPTPEPTSTSNGLQRDPTISWGKRRATQTPAPPEDPAPRSAFVAPPPPPPLMPKPPVSYIQDTIAADAEAKHWDHSRSVTPDLYDDEPNVAGGAVSAPPIPPKPSA
ncbi:arrestin [Ceratobasidium sp. AG-Ba]|nr:arrestin [Ceratobasidium sp. AG-Ba]